MELKSSKNDFLQKRSINLAVYERSKQNNPRVIAPAAVLIILVIGLFTKFMVIDRLSAAARAQSELKAVYSETERLRNENLELAEIKEEYNRYSKAAYNDSELVLVDVNDVLDILDRNALNKAELKSFVYSDNTINAVLSGVTLSEVSDIVIQLYREPLVESVSVSTAATNESSTNQKVNASMTIILALPQDDIVGGEGDAQ